MIAVGSPAPDFTLKAQDGSAVTLSRLRGRPVALFFFPRAGTRICTAQACAFRDHHGIFAQGGAEVLGISSDTVEAQKRFSERLKLPYLLLSDPGGKIRLRYRVPRALGILPGRATFLIDREGALRHVHVAHFGAASHLREAMTRMAPLLNEPRRTRSAGGVVLGPGGAVLVTHQFGTSWSLPKGHLEPGEDDLAAARREILEETGVSELELVRELGTYDRHRIGKHGGDDPTELKTIRMYLFRTRQEALSPQDPENPAARWVPPAEVAALLTHPKDREFFLAVRDAL